jgi:hypothetical protein
MRSPRANFNQIAVSAYARETAINTEQTLDLSLLAQLSDIVTPEFQRENNADEMTGHEEPTNVYDLGKTASLSLNFPKAQPQHFALLYAYALGSVVSAAAGSTGYQKTITPLNEDLDNYRSLPSITVAQRFGKTVFFERFASMFVDQVTAKFARNSWVEISGQLKGTGKSTTSIEEETVNAAGNATSLTLAANAVAGATAAERLDAIHSIKVELASGVWTDVAFSAVSSANPAVITITAPGGTSDPVDYKILYAPDEAAWMTFPARVSQTPLRVSEVTLVLGGTWTGTAFSGGKTLACEVNSIEHNLNNNGQIEFCVGTSGAYASRYFREGRTQTLSLDRELRDYIIRNYIDQNETFGVRILASGDEYESGHNYEVEMIFPKVAVLSAPISVNGKRLAERGDMTVLEDDTYGSVIVKVKDLQQYYAA